MSCRFCEISLVNSPVDRCGEFANCLGAISNSMHFQWLFDIQGELPAKRNAVKAHCSIQQLIHPYICIVPFFEPLIRGNYLQETAHIS